MAAPKATAAAAGRAHTGRGARRLRASDADWRKRSAAPIGATRAPGSVELCKGGDEANPTESPAPARVAAPAVRGLNPPGPRRAARGTRAWRSRSPPGRRRLQSCTGQRRAWSRSSRHASPSAPGRRTSRSGMGAVAVCAQGARGAQTETAGVNECRRHRRGLGALALRIRQRQNSGSQKRVRDAIGRRRLPAPSLSESTPGPSTRPRKETAKWTTT